MTFSLTGDLPSGTANPLDTRQANVDAPVDMVLTDGLSESSTGVIVDELLPPMFLDFFRDEAYDDAGKLTGYLDISSGPGWNMVVEYDADMNFRSSDYRESSGYHSRTVRETTFDASGAFAGFRETSYAEGGDRAYKSSSEFDANYNLISSIYADASGYSSSTIRTELQDTNGKLIGYQVDSSGGGNGYSYSSKETFDAAYALLASDYSDSQGYRSTYHLQIEHDAAGNISGYVTTATWTDGTTLFSSSDNYDVNWNHLGGDSSSPDPAVDGGPTIKPLIVFATADAASNADSAKNSMTSATNALSDEQDGSQKLAAMLKGSVADDLFIIDDARDHIVGTGRGNDTVISNSISVDLRRSVYQGIENITVTGRDDLNLRGDRSNNQLSGNAGDNQIDGGKGSDTLFGGLGDDVFVIRNGKSHAADTIADFTQGEDHIALDGDVFRALFDSYNQLRDGVLGDTLLYDPTTGTLSFDRDGASGPGTAQVITLVIGVSSLGADDFVEG